MRYYLALIFLLLPASLVATALDADSYQQKRQALIQAIQGDVKATARHIGKTELNPAVLKAMEQVPRHEFVSEPLQASAYLNRPLPIGHGQTISQPYIVALMTDLLQPDKDDKIFELGTGSGYQAAVLSPLVKEVYTMEIVPALGNSAKKRLKRLGYDNVTVRVGDAYYGWKEKAPFDGIVVTAAANHIPPDLLKQLKPGGRMVLPLGGPFSVQQLMLVTKEADGTYTTRQILPVRFVPVTRGAS